jgi:hypothetical protein
MLLEASLHARCAFLLFLEVKGRQDEGDALFGFLLKPALLSSPTVRVFSDLSSGIKPLKRLTT